MTKKRIFIHALNALNGGGQTYLINILNFWKKDKNLEIFITAPDSLSLPKSDNIKRVDIFYKKWNAYLRFIGDAFFLKKIILSYHADIAFFPGGIMTCLLPKRIKTVTMFRNMLPFDHQSINFFPLKERIKFNILRPVISFGLKRADVSIYISNFAKEYLESIGIFSKEGLVIHHGISEHFKIKSEKSSTIEAPYFLYTSIFLPYKHQKEVIQAFHLFKTQFPSNIKLVLAGKNDTSYGAEVISYVEEYNIPDVVFMGLIDYLELPNLYQNSKANIFASSCENCPNILLEILASGRPLLCSSINPMPEFAKDSALYFNPYRAQELYEKFCELDSSAEEDLIFHLNQRAKDFSWEITSKKTLDVLLKKV